MTGPKNFAPDPAPPDTVVVGRPLSAAEVAELTDLRALLRPETGIARLGEHARWIFTTSATVGTLGAAFSNSALRGLQGTGWMLFGVAITLTGASLALASLSLAPQWVRADLNRRDTLREAVQRQYRKRRLLLGGAVMCLASALVLAGLAPVFSNPKKGVEQRPAYTTLTYTLSDKGALAIAFRAAGLMPWSAVEIAIAPNDALGDAVAPRVRAAADAAGVASVTLNVEKVVASSSELVADARWTEFRADGAAVPGTEQLRIAISGKPKTLPPAGRQASR